LSFKSAAEFLYGLEKFGIKMDMQNIGALMEFAGNPHERLKVVHVAGTNGKGSTCAMIASALSSQRYKVGLYTSPHIVNFSERIKINGKQISEQDVAILTEFFQPEVVRLKATFFEATTAIMFKYFADNDVDYAIIETGLGGRLDATNIVDPIVSVITGIGLDHTEILGSTLEQIAFEKAGIVKHDKPSIVNAEKESVRKVFQQVASDRISRLSFVGDVSSWSNARVDIEGSVFDARVFDVEYSDLKIGLGGKHQIQNALTALSALQLLVESGEKITREAIYQGFERIKENTGHHGRLEILSREPLVILDVAHNPDGIQAVLESLSPLQGKRGILLFAAMRDKDAKAMITNLLDRFEVIILTQLQVARSLSVAELKKLSDNIKLSPQVFGNSFEALKAALNQTNNDSFLLITGSHYLAGEIMPVMEKTLLNFESC